jgi:hypothetical protein
VKKGDVVCVFYSGGPVYIIRFKDKKEKSEYAELIGEAYIHGLIEGEAFNSSDKGPDENFVLL